MTTPHPAELTEAERVRLRELADAATPGPWFVEFSGELDGKLAQIECARWRGYLNTIDLGEDHATADFIAAARTAVPALLDALEAAERDRDETHPAINLTEISNRHFEHDQALAESCDTCRVLTAYAQREQRWHWNLIREQVAENARDKAVARAEQTEADVQRLREGIEALAGSWERDRDTCLAWIADPAKHVDPEHPFRLSGMAGWLNRSAADLRALLSTSSVRGEGDG